MQHGKYDVIEQAVNRIKINKKKYKVALHGKKKEEEIALLDDIIVKIVKLEKLYFMELFKNERYMKDAINGSAKKIADFFYENNKI
jgi:hypothetical protein